MAGYRALDLAPEPSLPLHLLERSPFSAFVIPGLMLSLVVGGIQLSAFLLTLRRSRRAGLFSAAAASSILTWIFVQMVFIPFSFLQALYFAVGMAEPGFLLLLLGLIPATAPAPPHGPGEPRASSRARSPDMSLAESVRGLHELVGERGIHHAGKHDDGTHHR